MSLAEPIPHFPGHYQGLLFPPFRRGQETQAAAAEAIAPRTKTLRDRCLSYIRARGERGATNEEIAAALGLRLQTVCGRVAELRDLNWIEDSARRRAGASGVAAKVWVLHGTPRRQEVPA